MPLAIRSDNGVPFASPNALFNLSKLSVWWLRLGVAVERIKPGHPQQNGRHERMHLMLKKEATRPPGFNSLQQQDRFDSFLQEFNQERPHEALDMKRPADLYTASTRRYDGLPDLTIRSTIATSSPPPAAGSACIASGSTSQPCWPARNSASRKSTKAFGSSASCTMIWDISTWSRKPCNLSTTRSAFLIFFYYFFFYFIYPFHDRDVVTTACGRFCLHRKRINVSTVLAGQKLGIKEVDEGIWLVSFLHYDLGYFDLEQKTLQPLDNPFGTRLSPMS